MPNAYKNQGSKPNTQFTPAYLAPTGTTGIVQNIHVVNTTQDTVTVTCRWKDASNNNVSYILVNEMVLPSGVPTNLIDKALILEAGDSLEVIASAADAVHVTVAVLETA